MTMPTITTKDIKDSLSDVIQSIALEEAALAHILNAEGEKIQKVVEIASDTEEIIKIQESVVDVLQAVIKKEMLLQFKLEKVADLIKVIEDK
ncbi:MAG: hypothetical protein ACPLRZ_02005 [Thermovenabulum sp.]|uniref:hypothetical protein n=1 Tax=Thermovenabulum sp. TaxID=3100335 RepID=UPI003C7DD295